MKKKWVSKYLEQVFEINSNTSDWFGYYNYDPLSMDHNKLLCNRAAFDGCALEKGMSVEVGYYDIPEGIWHHIGETDSFNWQQGAMLQWIPGQKLESKVVYNFSAQEHFKSCIYDISTGDIKIIDYPIYCLTPDGKKAITLNYERSYWCRAYHYQSVANKEYDVRVAKDDGVFEVDLESNSIRRIVDIQDVINIDKAGFFDEAKHWLEHIMISPDGMRFVFLHRFLIDKNYATRVFIANIDGTGLQMIDGWRKYDWSHLGWKGNKEFAIYTVESNRYVGVDKINRKQVTNSPNAVSEIKNKIKSMIHPAVKERISHKHYYQHYSLTDGMFRFADKYDDMKLRVDGHPSFTLDGKYMITDSYPYENGNQHLIIMDTNTKKCLVVAEFYAHFSGNPASCDLHPKLSRDGHYITVDTAYPGKHTMVCFKINWELVKQRISN